jgi:hypothetical protein
MDSLQEMLSPNAWHFFSHCSSCHEGDLQPVPTLDSGVIREQTSPGRDVAIFEEPGKCSYISVQIKNAKSTKLKV